MASGWARRTPSWAGSSRTTRPPTTSSARSAAFTTRLTGSTRKPWCERFRAAAEPRLPADVDGQHNVEHRRLDADHGGCVGDAHADHRADLRGLAVGREHAADVPVRVLR